MKYNILIISISVVAIFIIIFFSVNIINKIKNNKAHSDLSESISVIKPKELPTLSSLYLYKEDAPINKPIDNRAKIDLNSEKMIKSLFDSGDFIISYRQYSAPVYFVDENTPRYNIKLECGESWEFGVNFLKDVPIPDVAEPSFDSDGSITPKGCAEKSDQDNEMIIVDIKNRCEYDFWQIRKEDGVWKASWGNAIDMDSNGIYNKGFSARGSGFSTLGGIIWPDEFVSGEINHALIFSYPFTKSGGPVLPASESDGESNKDYSIPEGARLRLNPTLDLNTLKLAPYEQTIAKALQKYGMFLVDNGGDTGISVYAIDPKSVSLNPYLGILPNKEEYASLSGIPLDAFEVLELSQQNSFLAEEFLIEYPRCAQFK